MLQFQHLIPSNKQYCVYGGDDHSITKCIEGATNFIVFAQVNGRWVVSGLDVSESKLEEIKRLLDSELGTSESAIGLGDFAQAIDKSAPKTASMIISSPKEVPL